MAITTQLRVATPGLGLTGGSSSNTGHVGKGLQKLAGLFKRDKTSDAPKIRGGRDFSDRHRMQLGKTKGDIDLARLFKGETARAKKAQRNSPPRPAPLPKDELARTLKAVADTAPENRKAGISSVATEFDRLLDEFNSGKTEATTESGDEITLSELHEALTDYAQFINDTLGGGDALDENVEKAVAELAKVAQQISDRLDAGKAKQTAPVIQPPTVQPQQQVAPSETLPEKLSRLEGKRDEIGSQLSDIAGLRRAILEKPGDRIGKWGEKQAKLTGARLKAHAEIDKALTEVNKLIATHSGDLSKAGELANLKGLRTELTRQAVSVEFPDVLGAMPKRFEAQSVVTALRGVNNIPAKDTIDRDALREMIGKDIGYILPLLDGFNAGDDPVALPNGINVSLATFRDELNEFMPILESVVHELAPTDEATAQLDIALAKLSELHKQVSIRVALNETIAALERFQIVPENTLTDLQKGQQKTALEAITPDDLRGTGLTQQDLNPKGRVGTKPAPIGTLLRAIRGAMPSIDIDGEGSGLTQKRNATEALSALVSLTVDGEPPDMLLGHGSALDQALLALKQERANGPTPPLTKQELIDAGKRRKAVALRQELTNANQRLEKLLKVNGKQVFGQGAGNVRKDAAFIDALHSLGGRKAGREVAFLLARISDLETKTLTLEKEVLGLHPDLDVTTLAPKPGAGILEHAGITDRDLDKMGLTGQDRTDLGKLVVELNAKGMGGVEDVQRTSRAIDKAINQVLRNELAQKSVKHFNEDAAGSLGRNLLNEFLVDARMRQTGQVQIDQMVGIKDPEVARLYQGQAKRIEQRITDRDPPGGWDKLSGSSDHYSNTQLEMVSLLGDFEKIEKTSDTHRDRLVRFNRDVSKGGLGLKVDTRNPRGLDSAKALIEALDAEEALKTDAGNQQLIAKREAALDRLKGFDPELMHTPWTNVRGSRPTIATLAPLREAAESIVYLRETAPREKQQVDDQIAARGKIMDDILAARANDNPIEMPVISQLTRTAILGSWPPGTRDTFQNGRLVEAYDPSAKRDEIIAQLKSWGVDTERFGPEIDKELYGTLSVEDMRRWSSEAMFFNDLRSREVTLKGMLLGMENFGGQRDMDDRTRRALLSSLESLLDGGKLSLKAGNRVTLDTGKIPVDPTGLNTLKAKLAGASVGHIEVERSSDGYRLHLRSGGEGKVGLDYALGIKLGDLGKLEAAGASAEGSLSHTGGVTLTFKGDDKGRQSLLNLMAKMIDNKPIGISDWSDAIDVGESTETQGKGSVTGRVGIRGEFMYKAEGGTKNDRTGIGLYAELSGMAGISGKSTDIGSQREHTHKGEVEVTTGVTFTGQLYARIGNPLNLAGNAMGNATGLTEKNQNYDLSGFQNSDLLTGSVGVSATYTQKWKQVTDDQGFYTKGEIVRQTDVTTDAVVSLLVVSDGVIAKKMEENQEFAENLKTMLTMIGRDDIVAVTYALTADALLHANTLLDQAKALRRDGEKGGAEELESRANAIAEAPDNHVPSKISVISAKIDKNEVANISARWIRWDTYSDGKLEIPALSLSLPA